jgi:hypothetical protein
MIDSVMERRRALGPGLVREFFLKTVL